MYYNVTIYDLFQKCQKPFFFKKPFRVNLNPGGGIAILNLNNWMFTMKNRHFMMSDSKVQKMLKKKIACYRVAVGVCNYVVVGVCNCVVVGVCKLCS